MNRLSLSGGAARGAGHLATAREVFELHGYDIEIDCTSVGGPVGIAYATGQLDAAEELFRGLPRFQRMRWPWQWLSGVYDLTPLRRELLRYLVGSSARCPVYVHTIRMAGSASKYERIRIDTEPVAFQVEAIVASCSQPPPVHRVAQIRGGKYVDGGAWHPMPKVPVLLGDLHYASSCAPLTWDLQEDDEASGGLGGLWDSARLLIEGDHEDDLERLRRQAANGAETWLIEPLEDPGPPMDFSPEWKAKRLDEIGPRAWAGRKRL